MDWIYRRIEPTCSNVSIDPRQIIKDGHAFCMGYTVALGGLLQREGYDLRWITMIAENHPRGRGPKQEETHETLEVSVDGRKVVLDPMSDTLFRHSLDDLLANPALADPCSFVDARGTERGYNLYNTSFWYERVVKFARRKKLRARVWYRTNRRQRA